MASLPPRPGGSDPRGGAPVQPPLQPSSSVPLQLPIHLALHNPLLPLGCGAGLAGGGGSVGMHAAPRAAYLAFPFVQQPGTAGGPTAATTIQLPHFQLPVAGGGGAALGGLQLGWPMGSGGGAAAAAAAPPPAASLAGWQPGLVLHTQAQMQAASDEHQRRLQQHQVRRQRRLAKHGRPVLPQPSPESDPIPWPSCEQAAQSAPAPQIMSNTDVGGSTEGTQAYDAARAGGGGTAGSGRGTLEADESAAAESRLKPGPSSRRGPVGEPRKSRFRWEGWGAGEGGGSGWRADCPPRQGGTVELAEGADSRESRAAATCPRDRPRLPPPRRSMHLLAGECSGTGAGRSGGRASTPTKRGTLVGGRGSRGVAPARACGGRRANRGGTAPRSACPASTSPPPPHSCCDSCVDLAGPASAGAAPPPPPLCLTPLAPALHAAVETAAGKAVAALLRPRAAPHHTCVGVSCCPASPRRPNPELAPCALPPPRPHPQATLNRSGPLDRRGTLRR